MLVTDVLREAFADVVLKHRSGVAFTLETNKVLDADSSLSYPVCAWKLPPTGLVQSASILQDTYSINCIFIDQTGSDRNAIERDGAHARMEATAKQVFRRFFKLYISGSGTWQGQAIDLKLQGTATFDPIYDDSTMQRTGVIMSATMIDIGPQECEDIYFNG